MRYLFALGLTLLLSSFATAEDTKTDPDYGVVLFEFFQNNYFDSLVEFEMANAHGGIEGHGQLPELVRGGISLSYGMEKQARSIFEHGLKEYADDKTNNNAWLYITRIHYERGDFDLALSTWSNIAEPFAKELYSEITYLGSLIYLQLGRYDEVITLNQNNTLKNKFRPFIEFNAGLAYIQQDNFLAAVEQFKRTVKLADNDQANRWALTDRSQLALAQLYIRLNQPENADQALAQVRQNGPYAKPAVLNQAWNLTNREDYPAALEITTALSNNDIAFAETQEALLLKGQLYEKLGLKGRALLAFETAASRYRDGFANIETLQKSLVEQDLLEALVDDLSATVQETDWFGDPPVLESTALTPFLYQLMATNKFQSLLKDLRDLYAVRLNLENWLSKKESFELIAKAQSRSVNGKGFKQRATESQQLLATQLELLNVLRARKPTLDKQQQDQAEAALTQIEQNLSEAKARSLGINTQQVALLNTDDYASRIEQTYYRLNSKLTDTERLVQQLEGVILKTINAYLGRQISRMRLYEVQARLAKARLLDAELVNQFGFQSINPPLPNATEGSNP